MLHEHRSRSHVRHGTRLALLIGSVRKAPSCVPASCLQIKRTPSRRARRRTAFARFIVVHRPIRRCRRWRACRIRLVVAHRTRFSTASRTAAADVWPCRLGRNYFVVSSGSASGASARKNRSTSSSSVMASPVRRCGRGRRSLADRQMRGSLRNVPITRQIYHQFRPRSRDASTSPPPPSASVSGARLGRGRLPSPLASARMRAGGEQCQRASRVPSKIRIVAAVKHRARFVVAAIALGTTPRSPSRRRSKRLLRVHRGGTSALLAPTRCTDSTSNVSEE